MSGTKPRVWIAKPNSPVHLFNLEQNHFLFEQGKAVHDDRGLTWVRGGDGKWHTPDNRHESSWEQLRKTTDLVEVL